MSRPVRMLLGVLLLTGLTACDTSNYAFRVDESIEIVEPRPRAEVPLPVQLRWTDDRPPAGARVAPRDPDAAYYAVFVDRAPMGAGKRLVSLLSEANRCLPSQECPTEAQLNELRVYLTAQPVLTLEFVADLRATKRGNTKDVHEITVVRMRGDRRIGEAAFLQTFYVRR